MSVDIGQTSRLHFSDYKLIDGVEFWDVVDLVDYIPQTNDIEHTFIDGDRLDLIAQQYYQDPVLAWVIAWANNIELNPTDIIVGQQLLIPSIAYVRNLLNNPRSS